MAVAAAATLAGDIGINMAEAVGKEPLNAARIQGVFLRSMELFRDMQGEDGAAEMPSAPGADPGPPEPAGPPMSGNGLMLDGMVRGRKGSRP